MLCTKWFCENGETAKGGQTLITVSLSVSIVIYCTTPAETEFYWKDRTLISAVLTGIHY